MLPVIIATAVLLVCGSFGVDGAEIRNLKRTVYPKDVNATAIRVMIEDLGYIYESYAVTTEDGYIINVNRMVHPKKKNKRDKGTPMLLVNGLFMQSEAWLVQGAQERNIAYAWAEKGYDIWLGDQRGTLRSTKHASLSTKDKKYWNFSFHETGIYDLPAFVDFILQTTGHKRLAYSCMSLGCTYHFVFLAERPEYNEKLYGGIDFVPVGLPTKRSDMPVSIQMSVVFLDMLQEAYKKTGLSHMRNVDKLKTELLALCKFGPDIILSSLSFMFGTKNHFEKEAICFQLALAVGGTSLKTIEHLVQIFASGDLAKYDHGREKNKEVYGTELPPLYDLGKITSFMSLYYSDMDVFSPTKVTEVMLSKFGGPSYGCEMLKFNHLDVATGTKFKPILDDVNEVLDAMTGNSNNTRKLKSGFCPPWVRNVG